MAMDLPALDFPAHALMEEVGVRILARSLRHMEEEGARIMSQLSGTGTESAGSGPLATPEAPVSPARPGLAAEAPLPPGAGTAVDAKA